MTHQEVLLDFADRHNKILGYQDVVAAAYAGARALDELAKDEKEEEYEDDRPCHPYNLGGAGGALDLSDLYYTAMGLGLPYDQCMTKEELLAYIKEKSK